MECDELKGPEGEPQRELAVTAALRVRGAARQPQGEAGKGSNKDTIFQDFLFQKQQRAMVAYGQALKSKIPVKIHKELL